jgi:pimeloyl-ACP methyl ester carboxylesterase
MSLRLCAFIVTILALLGPLRSYAESRWMTLPPTPSLPSASRAGDAPINGVRIWYAVFGSGEPVILLHGGLANSNYWGEQVRVLADHFEVIVMDSRGHGRSTRNSQPFSYQLMADDVVGLLDFLHIRQAAVVGWSDGAIIGLDLAMRRPERLSRLFAFAANFDPSGVADIAASPVFNAFIERAGKEYSELSPTPGDFSQFRASIERMWETQPNYTPAQLGKITIPVWVVDGDHDEAIKRPHIEELASFVPGAGLLIQPQVSHFSFIQDHRQFNDDLLRFLKNKF